MLPSARRHAAPKARSVSLPLLKMSKLQWALQATPLQARRYAQTPQIALRPNAGRRRWYWASVGIEFSCAPGLLNFLDSNQALVVRSALRERDI